jgi:hypothetical protein
LEIYIDKYFTTLDNFRNNKIKRIINDWKPIQLHGKQI